MTRNKNMLIYIKMKLYKHFPFNSLHLLRLTSFRIYFGQLHLPQILRKWGSQLVQNLLFFLMLGLLPQQNCSLKHFFSLKYSEPRCRQNSDRNFVLSKHFMNHLPFIIFVKNTDSKFVIVLQWKNEKYLC